MDENKEKITEEQEEKVFVPSPTSKRILAWVLFVVVIFGIISWLLNIAWPGWEAAVKAWVLGLF